MGLDGVELVLSSEEAFQIAISDEEARMCETPGMLSDLIYSKLRKSKQEKCPSMYGFYVVRKAMMEHFGLPREKIKPETKLDDLITRKNRSVVCKTFLKTLSGGQTMYAPLERPMWIKVLMFVVLLTTFVIIYHIHCLLHGVNVDDDRTIGTNNPQQQTPFVVGGSRHF